MGLDFKLLNLYTNIMASDFNKYRAQMFQISGFSLMVPVGKMVINFIDGELMNANSRFFVALLISIFLLFCGIMLLLKGLECVETRRIK